MSSDSSPDTGSAVQVCYRHPNRPTRLACSDCGRPICPACSIDAAVGQKCPQCVNRVGRQKTINARASMGRRSSGSPVTMSIIAVTALIYVLGDTLIPTLIHNNVLVASGEWWRIFTTALLHASLSHILFNMWALYALGPQIERAVGPGPFLALYVAAAGMGGAAAQALGPEFFNAVGASGAVFGLFGVWLNLAIRQRNTAYGRSLLNQMGFLLLINAALPLLLPQILWQAHVGGFVAGFVIGELWARVSGKNRVAIRTAVAVVVAVLAAVAAVVL